MYNLSPVALPAAGYFGSTNRFTHKTIIILYTSLSHIHRRQRTSIAFSLELLEIGTLYLHVYLKLTMTFHSKITDFLITWLISY